MSGFWEEMRAYTGFDEEAARRLRPFQAVLRAEIPRLVDEFYTQLDRHEAASSVFADDAQRARLRRTLTVWLEELVEGPHDSDYYERRRRIGRRHVEIRLPQRFMFGAMAVLRAGLVGALAKSGRDGAATAIESLGRLLDLELAVMLETYAEARIQKEREAERASTFEEALALEARLRVVEEKLNRVVAEESAIDDVVRELSSATGFEIVVVQRLDPTGTKLRLAAHHGLPPETAASLSVLDAHGGPLGDVRFGPQTLVLQDPDRNARPRPETRSLGLNTMITFPIRSGVEVLGALFFGTRRQTQLDEIRRGILQSIADHLGTALKTSTLSAREEHSRRFETLARFSRVLAHEVRNPLNSMGLQAALLRRRIAVLPEQTRVALEGPVIAFEQETRRLNELVEHYLLIGKSGDLHRERVRVIDLIDNVLGVQDPALAAANVTISVQHEKLGVEVEVDVAKLSQVLHNLVRNAMDAMSAGGSLTIGGESSDGKIRISVGDTGPGVSDPGLIFDMFFTTKPLGTGLGLPVAREIVRAHGGELDLTSGSRPGAEFVLTLPIAKPL